MIAVVPFLFGKPITAWLSILTGSIAFSLIIFAILLMHRRVRRLVSHQKVAYVAVAVITVHMLIGFIGRFILGV